MLRQQECLEEEEGGEKKEEAVVTTGDLQHLSSCGGQSVKTRVTVVLTRRREDQDQHQNVESWTRVYRDVQQTVCWAFACLRP